MELANCSSTKYISRNDLANLLESFTLGGLVFNQIILAVSLLAASSVFAQADQRTAKAIFCNNAIATSNGTWSDCAFEKNHLIMTTPRSGEMAVSKDKACIGFRRLVPTYLDVNAVLVKNKESEIILDCKY